MSTGREAQPGSRHRSTAGVGGGAGPGGLLIKPAVSVLAARHWCQIDFPCFSKLRNSVKKSRREKAGQSRKRDGSDIGNLGGRRRRPSDLIRERHFDSHPLFPGDPWDDRPTLGPIVSRFPSAIPAGQRGGLVARSGEAIPFPAHRRFNRPARANSLAHRSATPPTTTALLPYPDSVATSSTTAIPPLAIREWHASRCAQPFGPQPRNARRSPPGTTCIDLGTHGPNPHCPGVVAIAAHGGSSAVA